MLGVMIAFSVFFLLVGKLPIATVTASDFLAFRNLLPKTGADMGH